MTVFCDDKEIGYPGHIELADRANLLLIAPATSNPSPISRKRLGQHPLAAICARHPGADF